MREKYKNALMWVLYGVLFLFVTVFQTVVLGRARMLGVKLSLVPVAAACIAMHVGGEAGAIFGLAAGTFWCLTGAAGGAASDEAKSADAPTAAENGSSEPEYYCETAPIGESGREGKFLAADYGLPMFELYGAGATDYVLSSGGVKDGDAGFYYAPIAALRDLPEGLGMRQAQAETLALAPADAEWVLVYPNDDSEVPQP